MVCYQYRPTRSPGWRHTGVSSRVPHKSCILHTPALLTLCCIQPACIAANNPGEKVRSLQLQGYQKHDTCSSSSHPHPDPGLSQRCHTAQAAATAQLMLPYCTVMTAVTCSTSLLTYAATAGCSHCRLGGGGLILPKTKWMQAASFPRVAGPG